MNLKTFFIIIIFITSSCVSRFESINKSKTQNKPVKQKINLNGIWKFKKGNLKLNNFERINKIDSWESIKVPSNWYSEKYDFSGVAWYKKKFFIPNSLNSKILQINFEGIDYTGDIWLNGKYLGHHEGYFGNFNFDISEIVNYSEDNTLIVKVNSPNEEYGKKWSLNKRLIKGIFNHHDTRPGGAWSNRGQEKNTGGIWNNVYISSSNKISLKNHKLINNLDLKKNISKSNLKLNLYAKDKLEIIAKISIEPSNFFNDYIDNYRFSKNIVLKKGINDINFSFKIENPKLWWTWDYGKPNLYKMKISFFDKQGNLLDEKDEVIGFRKFEYKNNKFYLNEQKIFLKGTNYISTQWLSEMSQSKYKKDILLMKDANINSVRVHAHIEKKEFYNVLDQEGIIVWQDFPLQWGYEDTNDFYQEAKKQLYEMVDLLHNHPSIAIWCIHNEPPWDAKWMKYKYNDYVEDQNKSLDKKLYLDLINYDSSRYSKMISSTNEHPWYGWYSGNINDYKKLTTQNIVSEFGSQALPNLDSLRKILNSEDTFPNTKESWKKWDYHNFQKNEAFNNAGIKMGNNISEFIDNSQKYQSKIIKTAVESYRTQKYNPVTAIYQFMFVENWPSINWAIIDHWRHKKIGYDMLKKVYQPILPIALIKKDLNKPNKNINFDLWISNDTLKDYNDLKINLIIRNRDQIISSDKININLLKNSTKIVMSVNKRIETIGKYEIIMKVFDKDNKIISINNNNFEIL